MGLSKPIVIASSNIDISNLATKADLEGLGGAVKSVQEIVISSTNTYANGGTKNGAVADSGLDGQRGIDYTISAVNKEKTFIVTMNSANLDYGKGTSARLIDGNKVRVYENYYAGGSGYITKSVVQIVELV